MPWAANAILQKKICGCEADYVLALKGKQSELQEMVSDFFSTAIEKNLLLLNTLEPKIMIMGTDELNQGFFILYLSRLP